MSSILGSVHETSSSLGPHYKEVLNVTLANLWRGKWLILKTVVAALALGIVISAATPLKYTAEAYVHGGLVAPNFITGAPADRVNSGAPLIGFDASLLVETRSRLMQSHQLARQVVDRLGFDRLRSEVSGGSISSWLQAFFYGVQTDAPGYKEDLAAEKLLRGLTVKTEPRVYLIKVSYTSGVPELATLIANAFVIEYLRATTLESLYGQRAAAEATLSEYRATFGDKHPKVEAAKARLTAVNSLLKAELAKTAREVERSVNENVTLARTDTVPSAPKPLLIIGLSLFLGLAVGIAIAYWQGPSAAPPVVATYHTQRPSWPSRE